ncbi:XdhC family protein [Hymenobacter jejuensis]|uniref:XdhC family protein n=1 Tax=Hymenobacter jejuensis TaxID=2502781 RepID=A0A5B7ZV50_9BACT|nr:XdhC/CoxI family protein [Hymenobacter jejuensis]QDA58717.1 XdhC family protein [Hymenobacter jejuensis]
MSELRRLLAAYDVHRTEGRACALATVVHVDGSSYRRPGARMLVTADGQLTGAISGGCLEGDARRRARQAIQRGRPTLVTYDSTDPDDDLRHGAGLGCQGVVKILLEPLDFNDSANPVELLRVCAVQDVVAVLATVFSLPTNSAVSVGERLLLTADGTELGGLTAEPALHEAIISDARQVLHAQQPATYDYQIANGTLRVFLEVVRPAVRFTIYGAGNDVQPLVRFASALGWRVTVIDGRPNLTTAARFPEAESVRAVPLAEVSCLPADDSLAVLMTHNYHYDQSVLRHLLTSRTPYIGILGPRKKTEQLLSGLRAEGLKPDAHLKGCLYGPVGLNIGAETPEEIALSVVAEIQAVLTQRSAGFLRDSTQPIHARTAASPVRAVAPVSSPDSAI